jgi:hypothetical protein
MAKYGFDYYTERANVLSEMARLPQQLLAIGPAGERMYKIRKYVNEVMKRGGSYTDEDGVKVDVPGLPSGRGTPLQNRSNRYIIRAISGLMDDVPEDYENVRDEMDFGGGGDEITKKAIEILGYQGQKRSTLKSLGITDSNSLYSRAIEKWTSENQDIVMSPEFTQKITNPTNILQYLTPPVRKASHTVYGQNKTKEKEELYGMDLEDVHAIISGIAPYLKKIHKSQGYKKAKKIAMAPGSSKKLTGSDEEINNRGTKNVAILLAILENLIAAKTMLSSVVRNNISSESDFNNLLNVDNPNEMNEGDRQIFTTILQQAVAANERYMNSEFSEDEISALLRINSESPYADILTEMMDFFEELIETGLTVEECQKELNFYKSSILDEKIYPIINKLNKDLLTYTDEEPNVEYPEYSQEILSQVLNTPQLQELFKSWYTKIYIPEKLKKLQSVIDTRESSTSGQSKVPGEQNKLQSYTPNENKKLS